MARWRNGDDGKIKLGIGIEGFDRREREYAPAPLDEVHFEFAAEFRQTAGCDIWVGKNVVIGDQKGRRGKEDRRIVRRAADRAESLDAADCFCGLKPLFRRS